ncbi:hypothetical protein VCHC41A1_3790, partial [Vibrio cholerae HC-41A1]
MFRQSGGGA